MYVRGLLQLFKRRYNMKLTKLAKEFEEK